MSESDNESLDRIAEDVGEVDELISLDEAEELLSEISPSDGVLTFEGDRLVYDVNDSDSRIEFVSFREDPSTTVRADGVGETTASRYLIRHEGTLYEVETDGPFEVTIPGLGDAIEE